MIIRRLRLANFRKYAEADLEFPEGLIGLVGNNGAGKTTLFEAIAFALYGVNASRTKGKGIRRDGTDVAVPCRVELEFTYAGEPYRVMRELRGVNETQAAEVYAGDINELLAHRAAGVDSFIHNCLGMDYKTFIRSIFARQKEIAVLTDERPEERRRAIRRMMGIERIEKAIQQVREDRKEKRDFIQGAEIAIKGLDEQIREHDRMVPQFKTAKQDYQRLEKKAQQQQEEVQQARQVFSKQEEAQKQFNALERQIDVAEAAIQGLDDRIEETSRGLNKLKQSRRRLQKIKPQLREYQQVKSRKEQLDKAQGAFAERQQIENEIPGLAKAVQHLKNQAATQQKELGFYKHLDTKIGVNAKAMTKTDKMLNNVGKALKSLQGKLESKEDRLAELKSSLQNLRKGREGKCPTCLRPVSGSFEEIEAHFAEERAKLEQAKHELQIQASEQEKIEKSAESAKRKLHTKEKELQDQQRARDAAKIKLDSLNDQLADKHTALTAKQKRQRELRKVNYIANVHMQTRQRLNELQGIYNESQGLRREVDHINAATIKLKQLKTQVGNNQNELEELISKRKSLAFHPVDYENARDAYQAAHEVLETTREQESDARVTYRDLKSELNHIEKEIKEKQAQKNQIEADQKTIQYLEQLEVIFKDFQTSLINRIRPLLADRASLLLDQITEGRYSRVEFDEDYQIFLRDGGNRYPIRRFSGGEEDLANLCLRVAISQTLAELVSGAGWGAIAFDEVFGSQDRIRRERLLQALQSLTGSFRQIFFITHIEDLHDRVPYVLHISEDTHGAAIVQWAK